jgi:uncharacterized cupredoxin-like copper-binding protein
MRIILDVRKEKPMTKRTAWMNAGIWMIVLILLSGCVTVDYVEDAQSRVKAADWSKMQTLSVVLKEYSYAPSHIQFKTGVPYKLQIQNKGTVKHYFTAEEFFKGIATRKVQSNADGEIKAPYFSALEVFPGRSLDLYFIPVKKGSYRLHCTITGHEAEGMHGVIIIE